jgi:hypothetical protein
LRPLTSDLRLPDHLVTFSSLLKYGSTLAHAHIPPTFVIS